MPQPYLRYIFIIFSHVNNIRFQWKRFTRSKQSKFLKNSSKTQEKIQNSNEEIEKRNENNAKKFFSR